MAFFRFVTQKTGYNDSLAEVKPQFSPDKRAVLVVFAAEIRSLLTEDSYLVPYCLTLGRRVPDGFSLADQDQDQRNDTNRRSTPDDDKMAVHKIPI